MKKEKSIYSLLWKIAFITGVVVSVMMYFSYIIYEDITNLYLLPIAYTASMLIVKGYYREENMGVAVAIIEVTKFVRFILLPLIYVFSDQVNRYIGLDLRYDYHTRAVGLMCYELLAISVVMYLFLRNERKKRRNVVPLSAVDFQPGQTVKLFAILWVLLVLLVGSFREQLLNFGVTETVEGAGAATADATSNISNIVFNFGKIFIYAILLHFAKGSRDSFGKFTIILIASVLFISSSWNDGGMSISRWGLIVSSLLSVYALYCYFPEKKKAILTVAPFAILGIMVAGTLAKMATWGLDTSKVDDTAGTLFASSMFDAYFQGVYSVSNGLSTADTYANNVHFTNFLSELFYHFPFAVRILGLNGMWAEYYYKIGIGDESQICPSLIQSYYYFGAVGSPFFSCLAVFLALYFTRKLNEERNFTARLLYVYGIFWLALYNCINYTIVEAHIWFAIIGIWVCRLDGKKGLKLNKQKAPQVT